MHQHIFLNPPVADLPKVRAGGKAHRQPQDRGFMYGHGFEDLDGHGLEDLDGHIWALANMHMSAAPPP